MYESYFKKHDECYFLAHSDFHTNRPTLLFLHGIGDSAISYEKFFHTHVLDQYNLIVPDLLGYGRSSAASNYSFEHQVQGIVEHINFLQAEIGTSLDHFVLVAHSMSSIHALLLCNSSLKAKIKKLVAVEGSVTQYGSFVSAEVMKVAQENQFPVWFSNFKQHIFEQANLESSSLRDYYASLLFCRPQAFLRNAIEMRKLSLALPQHFSHIMGQKYIELNIPKIYCYGNSLCPETLQFLKEHQMATQYFNSTNHFVMTECFNDFVSFLAQYINKIV